MTLHIYIFWNCEDFASSFLNFTARCTARYALTGFVYLCMNVAVELHALFIEKSGKPTAQLLGRFWACWRKCCGGATGLVAKRWGVRRFGVMSESCLLNVPGLDENRHAGLGLPVWSCHHGHLLTAIITNAQASHWYSIQTQLRAPAYPPPTSHH